MPSVESAIFYRKIKPVAVVIPGQPEIQSTENCRIIPAYRLRGTGTTRGFLLLLLLITALLLSGAGTAGASIQDTAYEKTLAVFKKLPGLTTEKLQANEKLLRSLSYTHLRAFRAFCNLPGMKAEEAVEILRRLPQEKIQYEHIPLLERLARLDGTSALLCWQLLARLKSVSYVSSRALAGLADIQELSATELFRLIDRVEPLNEPGRWAAGALFKVPRITGAEVSRGLALIERLTERQRWAAEQHCKIKGITAEETLRDMGLLHALTDSDAWNARGLFMLPGMTPKLAGSWLTDYFSIPDREREDRFQRMAVEDKALLLKVFAAASDYPLWRINNLHDITDSFGQEISGGTLAGYSGNGLNGLFQRLQLAVQRSHAHEMSRSLRAGNHSATITVLRRATAAARKQTAVDLTSANIYVLLAHSGDLYDSSFRDILVPVLKQRLAGTFGDDLLSFLLATDPGNLFTSDFIASLAQRGKLTVFFPQDAEKQQQVLDLVGRSALQNEFSLILFSATFTKLLETITPAARSSLLSLLLDAGHSKNSLLSRQVRVILQYFHHEHPALLPAAETLRIRKMLKEFGTIDLGQYARTPFHEWKSDGQLKSLSVFQSDDDGRTSYLTNCQTLIAGGYRPEISQTYRLDGLDSNVLRAAQPLVAGLSRKPGGLTRLLQLSANHPLVVDWVRTVGGLRLAHSVFIYQGKATQQQLIKQFLKGDNEMFAQRGHSYWRREQLIDPIRDLLESGAVSALDLARKQRFLSIGSCGGIRAYTDLNRLFHNHVDILATIGTGKSSINNPYNQQFFEIIARNSAMLSWQEVARSSATIFIRNLGEDYIQPGSLPAILHKIMDLKPVSHGTDKTH